MTPFSPTVLAAARRIHDAPIRWGSSSPRPWDQEDLATQHAYCVDAQLALHGLDAAVTEFLTAADQTSPVEIAALREAALAAGVVL